MKSTTTSYGVSEIFLILLLALSNFTHVMDFVIMAPLNFYLQESLHIGTKEFSVLLSSYTFAAALTGIAGFFYIDQFNRRTAMLFIFTGFTISNVFCALADSYWYFLLARMSAGAFGGVFGALILATISDTIPVERRGFATGLVFSAFALASVVGIPSGLFLVNTYQDIHLPFWLISALSVLVLALLIWKFPSLNSHVAEARTQSKKQIMFELLSRPNVGYALLFTMLVMMAGFLVVPHVSNFLVRNVGLPDKQLLWVYLVGGIGSAISGPTVGRMADAFGKRKVYQYAAFLAVFPILGVTLLPKVDFVYLMIFVVFFFVLFGARFSPAMAMMTTVVEGRLRGSFLSLQSTVQHLSQAFGAFFSGMIIVEAGGRMHLFWVVGIIGAVFSLLSIWVSHKLVLQER
jgi:predicted MFS family arabinose efflux permease